MKSFKRTLIKEKFFKDSDVLDNRLIDIKNAYPILKVGEEGNIRKLVSFIQSFSNQKLIGRNVEFDYLHTHKIYCYCQLLMNFSPPCILNLVGEYQLRKKDIYDYFFQF